MMEFPLLHLMPGVLLPGMFPKFTGNDGIIRTTRNSTRFTIIIKDTLPQLGVSLYEQILEGSEHCPAVGCFGGMLYSMRHLQTSIIRKLQKPEISFHPPSAHPTVEMNLIQGLVLMGFLWGFMGWRQGILSALFSSSSVRMQEGVLTT